MKKIIEYLFIVSLAVWFLDAVYLSINYVFNLFIDTNPNIARLISAISFITLVITGVRNYRKTGSFVGAKIEKQSPQRGCKNCKSR